MKYPDDEDGRVLAGLAADGMDMSMPRLIDFPVAVPNEEVAKVVAKAVADQGYEAEIYFDEGDADDSGRVPDAGEFAPSWSVYVEVTMVPEHSRIVEIQSELDRIAGPLGGKSDGWGTMSD
jgi:hypothetical protein